MQPCVRIAALAVFIAAFTTGLLINQCACPPSHRGATETVRIDSVPVLIPIPGTNIHDTVTKFVRLPARPIDSSRYAILLRALDSVQAILRDSSVSVVMRLDTITATHDTITVECDEIQRSISLQYLPAPRTVMTAEKTITITLPAQPVSFWEKLLYVGAGAGAGLIIGSVK